MIKLKRAYRLAAADDGFRVLVERLWPRGLSKAEVAMDLWLKEVTPSPELRKWFGHDPLKWEKFCRRYWAELAEKARQSGFSGPRPGRAISPWSTAPGTKTTTPRWP